MTYPTKKLGEIALVQAGGTPYRGTQDFWGGTIPWLKISELNNGFVSLYNETITEEGLNNSSAKLFKKGTILYSIFATIGKMCILNIDATTNQAIAGITANENIVDKMYLFFSLKYYTYILIEQSIGVAQNNINSTKLKALPIPLPQLLTQKIIVQKLDSAFKNIDESINITKENIENIEELNKSVLNKSFGEGKYKIKNFGDIVDNYDGKRRPVKASERKSNHGTYPYYGASGIIDYVDGFTHEGESLLISEDGANLVVRKYPIAFIADGKYWVNNHAHIVKGKESISNNHYLKYFFANINISYYITGSAQPKFNQKNLNSVKIPLPPIERQKEIVLYLDEVFEKNKVIKERYKKKLKDLEEMKQSILKEAFEGRLVKE